MGLLTDRAKNEWQFEKHDREASAIRAFRSKWGQVPEKVFLQKGAWEFEADDLRFRATYEGHIYPYPPPYVLTWTVFLRDKWVYVENLADLGRRLEEAGC